MTLKIKKILAVVLCGAIVLSLTACTKKQEDTKRSAEQQTEDIQELEDLENIEQESIDSTENEFEDVPAVGTWVLPESIELASGEDDVFFKAFDGSERYSPIALIGQQLVAGMNYRYLCVHEVDGEQFYSIVELYKDLEGNVSMTSARDFESPEDPELWQTVEFHSMEPDYQSFVDGAEMKDYDPIAVVCRSLSKNNGYAFLYMRGPVSYSYGISASEGNSESIGASEGLSGTSIGSSHSEGQSESEGSSVSISGSVSVGSSFSESSGSTHNEGESVSISIGHSTSENHSESVSTTSETKEMDEYVLVYVQEVSDGEYLVQERHLK